MTAGPSANAAASAAVLVPAASAVAVLAAPSEALGAAPEAISGEEAVKIAMVDAGKPEDGLAVPIKIDLVPTELKAGVTPALIDGKQHSQCQEGKALLQFTSFISQVDKPVDDVTSKEPAVIN